MRSLGSISGLEGLRVYSFRGFAVLGHRAYKAEGLEL